MAGQNSNLNLDNSQRKYPGPNSFTWTPSPLPDGTDLGKGYIPEATERGAPNTGNPWKGG